MKRARTKRNRDGIGPVPVEIPPEAKEIQRIEDVERPFKVDRNDPNQQELAKKVGWGRLVEIEKEEREAFECAKEL